MSPGAQIFMTPLIGVICLVVILASWLGGVRYPDGIPGGLMAIIVGAGIAWIGQLARLSDSAASALRRSPAASPISASICRRRPSPRCSAASNISA